MLVHIQNSMMSDSYERKQILYKSVNKTNAELGQCHNRQCAPKQHEPGRYVLRNYMIVYSTCM